MIVVIDNDLPKSTLFAYDGELLIVNCKAIKEAIEYHGRTVAEIFEEVFSTGKLLRADDRKLSYQLIDIPKMANVE